MSALNAAGHACVQAGVALAVGTVCERVFVRYDPPCPTRLVGAAFGQIAASVGLTYLILSSAGLKEDPMGGLVLSYSLFHVQETIGRRLRVISQCL